MPTIAAEWEKRHNHLSPVIPGGVKRRPGIHAEALDSRFRGNDGGMVLKNPVIPDGVERRPGIHAEALDSRFPGNDGVVA